MLQKHTILKQNKNIFLKVTKHGSSPIKALIFGNVSHLSHGRNPINAPSFDWAYNLFIALQIGISLIIALTFDWVSY